VIEMKLTFLGTGASWGAPVWSCDCKGCTSTNPKNKRMRSSLLIEIGDIKIVIDCGPDFHRQMMKHEIRRVDHVLITHHHDDHTAGISQLGAANGTILETPADVWDYWFPSNDGRKTWLERRKVVFQDFKPKNIGNVAIDSIKLEHKMPFVKDAPCYGYVFRSPDFSFAYCSDYNKILEPEKVENLDLLISCGTQFQPELGHVGIVGSVEIFRRFKPKKMILTHIGHMLEHTELEEYLKEQNLFPQISVAYDGLKI